MSPAELFQLTAAHAQREADRLHQPPMFRDPQLTPRDLNELRAIVGRLKGAFICSESRSERRELGEALLPLVADLDMLILACGLDS